MQKKELGKSTIQITPIGFGSWAIGGADWAYGWGAQDDGDAIRAIERAIELGINWIDTAAVYGLGHSEELVAKAVAGIKNPPLIFTKCSLVWDDRCQVGSSLKADSIRRECEASLKRLKEEGLVRHIGVSNFSVAQLRRIIPIAPVASVQPPYSMLRPAIENELLPFCMEQNIGVIVYSPMLSGMLSGAMTRERAINFAPDDWRRNNKEFKEPHLSANIALAELLRQIGAPHGCTAGEVAIAWTLRHPAITGTIVGGRNADQVEGTIGAGELKLDEDELATIRDYIAGMPQ